MADGIVNGLRSGLATGVVGGAWALARRSWATPETSGARLGRFRAARLSGGRNRRSAPYLFLWVNGVDVFRVGRQGAALRFGLPVDKRQRGRPVEDQVAIRGSR